MAVVQPFPAFLTLSERGGRNEKGKRKGDPHPHPSIAAVVGALSVGGGGSGAVPQWHFETVVGHAITWDRRK